MRICPECGTQFQPKGPQKRCSVNCRDKHIKEYDRLRSGVRGTERKHYAREDKVDPHFWKNIDSQEKAWLLGFTVTDGNVDDYQVRWHLKSSDVDILNWIKDFVGCAGILDLNEKDVNFKVCCREWVHDLRKLGLEKSKSLTVHWIDTPFSWDFVRGLWDGDGSISFVNDVTPVPEFGTASWQLFDALFEWLVDIGYNPTPHIREPKKDNHHVFYRLWLNAKDARDFLPRLYVREPRLARKYELVQRIGLL